MNVILYTEDFEPITVIDLPRWLLDDIERQGRIRVSTAKAVSGVQPECIDIYCAKVAWIDGTYKPILVTPDEELALEAVPHWLPGQVATVHAYKRNIKELMNRLIKAMRK